MFFQSEAQLLFNEFFQKIRLKDQFNESGKDKSAKAQQILSYLEIIHSQTKHYSKKRELVFIDCGAGNCYLSFLVYYFYSVIEPRPIRIHCLDTNQQLMEKNQQRAEQFGFQRMFFHACDIEDFTYDGRPDMVYSLHACDTATDKTLYLGVKTNSRNILSVSCCQHSIVRKFKGHPLTGVSCHPVFKNKLAYMVGDSLRAMLLEMNGYQVDIIEFTSSRHTDKNIMLRARKGQAKNTSLIEEQYQQLSNIFHLKPSLEGYLQQCDQNTTLNTTNGV